MADDPSEGLLSQDDINAALTAASMESEMVDKPTPSPASAGTQPKARADSAGRPFDEVANAMAEAIATEHAATKAAAPPAAPASVAAAPSPAGTASFDIPELPAGTVPPVAANGMDLLRDVNLNVKIELGRSRMLVEDVLRLGEGSVVELDKLAGDPVDVLVNDRLIARGEVLVLNDNFCVRINDILSKDVGQEEMG
jgi:flagellar motor switch protein FliN/FliY